MSSQSCHGVYRIQLNDLLRKNKKSSKPQVPKKESDNNDFKKVCHHCKKSMPQAEFNIHVCSKKVEAEKLGKPS